MDNDTKKMLINAIKLFNQIDFSDKSVGEAISESFLLYHFVRKYLLAKGVSEDIINKVDQQTKIIVNNFYNELFGKEEVNGENRKE